LNSLNDYCQRQAEADLVGKDRELLTVEDTERDRLPRVKPVDEPQASKVQQDHTGVETTVLGNKPFQQSIKPNQSINQSNSSIKY